MTSLLLHLFNPHGLSAQDPRIRRRFGTLAGAVGIIVNLLLFAAKFTAGSLFASVAVVADAFNNLTDAGSSIISIISARISAKPADREHPFGHARIEYIASMVVSFLILYIGIQLMKDSVNSLIHAEETESGLLTIIVLVCSICMKLWLFLFYRKVGKVTESSVLRASALDSLSDCISTGAVLVSALIVHFTSFAPIDGIMGALVSIFILIAGIRILRDTMNSLLGEAPMEDVTRAVLDIVARHPDALGVHDMLVHSYGPGHTLVSMHVEVDGEGDIYDLHEMIDNIERQVHAQLGIICTIHMDPIVIHDERVNELRNMVSECVKEVDERIDVHDFRCVIGRGHTNLIFDISVPFEIEESEEELKTRVSDAIRTHNPDCFCIITVDRR